MGGGAQHCSVLVARSNGVNSLLRETMGMNEPERRRERRTSRGEREGEREDDSKEKRDALAERAKGEE